MSNSSSTAEAGHSHVTLKWDAFHFSFSWSMNSIKVKNSRNRQWKHLKKRGTSKEDVIWREADGLAPERKNRRQGCQGEASDRDYSEKAFHSTSGSVGPVAWGWEGTVDGPDACSDAAPDLCSASVRATLARGLFWLLEVGDKCTDPRDYCELRRRSARPRSRGEPARERSLRVPEELAAAQVRRGPHHRKGLVAPGEPTKSLRGLSRPETSATPQSAWSFSKPFKSAEKGLSASLLREERSVVNEKEPERSSPLRMEVENLRQSLTGLRVLVGFTATENSLLLPLTVATKPCKTRPLQEAFPPPSQASRFRMLGNRRPNFFFLHYEFLDPKQCRLEHQD